MYMDALTSSLILFICCLSSISFAFEVLSPDTLRGNYTNCGRVQFDLIGPTQFNFTGQLVSVNPFVDPCDQRSILNANDIQGRIAFYQGNFVTYVWFNSMFGI